MITPRDFQRAAIRNARRALKNGQRVLITSPPGSGKTVIGAELARLDKNNRRRILIIAQRREILRQTIHHLRQVGVDRADIGAIYPESDAPLDLNRPIQVSSAATLMRRHLAPEADTVILDEAHHAVAEGHASILSHYLAGRLVGMTATPIRLDGRGLGDIFDVLITAAKPSELIIRNMLAKPRSFTAPEEFLPDLDKIRRAMGDFVLGPLAERVNRRELVGNIVDHYQRRAGGRTALVFASTVEHSRHIVSRFEDAGVHAEHLDSSMSIRDRDSVISNLRTGTTHVVTNVGILHEGFDLPRTYAVILARPTLSLALYLQQTGRALRRYGNHRPLILDHARNVIRFGLPEADRDFDLTETVETEPSGRSPVRICPACMAILPAGYRTCPECDEVLVEPPAMPEEIQRQLEELTSARKGELESRLRAFLARRGENDPVWVERVVELWTAYNSGTA